MNKLTLFLCPGHGLPQLFLPHRHLLSHHFLPPLSLPLPLHLHLPLRSHHRGPAAAPAEAGSGHWMRRLASVTAPSKPRAAAGRSEGSTLSAAGQSAQPQNAPLRKWQWKKDAIFNSLQLDLYSFSCNQIYPQPFSRWSVQEGYRSEMRLVWYLLTTPVFLCGKASLRCS